MDRPTHPTTIPIRLTATTTVIATRSIQIQRHPLHFPFQDTLARCTERNRPLPAPIPLHRHQHTRAEPPTHLSHRRDNPLRFPVALSSIIPSLSPLVPIPSAPTNPASPRPNDASPNVLFSPSPHPQLTSAPTLLPFPPFPRRPRRPRVPPLPPLPRGTSMPLC